MSTTVTPADVAVELGLPTPLDAQQSGQFEGWIARVERMIRRRANQVGVPWDDVDLETLDDVVLLAVTQHARNPDGVESYDVSVDDGREMRRFRAGSGELTITDLWWSWLFPDVPASGAFSVRPYGASDVCVPGLVDWS